jgi:hypothetical protein
MGGQRKETDMSFSINLESVLSTASTFVNGLLPVYLLPLGITVAVGILGMLSAAFNKIFRG